MPKTFVLITLYQGDTEILAAGDDLERMRRALRAEARRVVSTGEYNTPLQKELKAKILAALKEPDIMSWDDGEIEDLYSIEIKEIPLWMKKKTPPDWQARIITFLKERFFTLISKEEFEKYKDDEVFFSDPEIICEGMTTGKTDKGEHVNILYVSKSGVTVELTVLGSAGDGRDDLTRTVPLKDLKPSLQEKIYNYVTKNFNADLIV